MFAIWRRFILTLKHIYWIYVYYFNSNPLIKYARSTSKNPELYVYINKLITEKPEFINQQDSEGWTALMITSRYSGKNSTEKTVEILLKAFANVDLQDNKSWTALMLAARYSNTDSTEKTVKMLLEAGADVNLQNDCGYTALMLASQYSNTGSTNRTVKMLLNAGADLNLQSNRGSTAIILAACNHYNTSSSRTVEMLIKAGANVNIQNHFGNSALIASQFSNNKKEVVEMLIEAGADVNLYNIDGNTALIHACVSKSPDRDKIIKILIDAGADVNLRNKKGFTAISLIPDTPNKCKISNILLDAMQYQIKLRLLKLSCYKFVLSGIPYKRQQLKFNPNNIGSNIIGIRFRVLNGENIEDIYYKLLNSGSFILDYLSVRDGNDLLKKINSFN